MDDDGQNGAHVDGMGGLLGAADVAQQHGWTQGDDGIGNDNELADSNDVPPAVPSSVDERQHEHEHQHVDEMDSDLAGSSEHHQDQPGAEHSSHMYEGPAESSHYIESAEDSDTASGSTGTSPRSPDSGGRRRARTESIGNEAELMMLTQDPGCLEAVPEEYYQHGIDTSDQDTEGAADTDSNTSLDGGLSSEGAEHADQAARATTDCDSGEMQVSGDHDARDVHQIGDGSDTRGCGASELRVVAPAEGA